MELVSPITIFLKKASVLVGQNHIIPSHKTVSLNLSNQNHLHIMLCRIIFCITFSLAILSVILLSLFSPTPKNHSWLAISLYIQPPQRPAPTTMHLPLDSGAFIFHHTLTEGPENTSRIIGKAQGFIIPIGQFAHSDFNVVYLTFDTPKYSGSLSVRAKHVGTKGGEELTVVGGTGSFAFARGLAVFARTDGEGMSYNVKLQLRFPHENIWG